jgi:hypothetical protein
MKKPSRTFPACWGGRRRRSTGSAVAAAVGAFNGRPVTDLRQLRILDLRYGTIRAQALPPESPAVTEQLLGQT